MKKLLAVLSIAVLGVLMLGSCSDSSNNTTPEEKDLFPAKVGSHWVYERTYVEDNETKTTSDSVIVVELSSKFGKDCQKYNTFIGGVKYDEFFRFSAEGKLYALPSELLPSDLTALLPAEIFPQDWVVIADDNSNTWNMFTIPVDNVNLQISGANAVLNGEIKVSGQKGAKANMTVSGKTYSTQEFITKIAYTGKVTYGPLSPDLTFEVVTKSYFADKVGLVKLETPKQDVTINLGAPITLYTIQPLTRMLHHFDIVE
ncbi:hypothetical protein MASR1M45_01570 [Candidatus Kapaibacterium sp.]